jgi:hypothetical protein
MILTREEGWSEVKVGRIFKSSDCIHAEEKPRWISNSQYVAYSGNHKTFTETMDNILDEHDDLNNRLVFISNGATWIKKWVEDAFPKAVSILDYYHVCEHLHEFSNSVFRDKVKEKLDGKTKRMVIERNNRHGNKAYKKDREGKRRRN